VILTRQGRGSFVADNANLGAHLQWQELDAQLATAVHTAALLGIKDEALVQRLREIERRLTKSEP
jgi:GntR family transcriptional regulator